MGELPSAYKHIPASLESLPVPPHPAPAHRSPLSFSRAGIFREPSPALPFALQPTPTALLPPKASSNDIFLVAYSVGSGSSFLNHFLPLFWWLLFSLLHQLMPCYLSFHSTPLPGMPSFPPASSRVLSYGPRLWPCYTEMAVGTPVV